MSDKPKNKIPNLSDAALSDLADSLVTQAERNWTQIDDNTYHHGPTGAIAKMAEFKMMKRIELHVRIILDVSEECVYQDDIEESFLGDYLRSPDALQEALIEGVELIDCETETTREIKKEG